MDVSFVMWPALVAVVAAMLAFDLVVFGRGRRAVTLKQATVWSVV